MTTSHGDGDQELYEGYSVDDEDQPSNIEGLGDPDVADELDRGYSPPEKWSAAEGYGNTPWEEEHRETIDQRVGQEIPEQDPYQAAAEADLDQLGGDGEVGAERAGRLVAPDEGVRGATEADLVGDDVGIDGAAASAEEAAVHVVDDLDDLDDLDDRDDRDAGRAGDD